MVLAVRPIRTIFHPSDFSEGSEVAFAHAVKIAMVAGAALDVLHVSESRELPWTEFPRVRAMLERWKVLPPNSPKSAVTSIGIDVRKVIVKDSDPVRAAGKFLEDNPTDLVVLAAHAEQGHMRWGRSSVSRPIARAAAAAALFLPYGSEGFVSRADGSTSLRNILLPVDAKPKPGNAVEAACRLAWGLQCPEVNFTLLHVGGAGEMPAIKTEEQEGWSWKKVSRQGEVVEVILTAAKQTRADLIVMTTEGRHGFLDGLRGSTTERVLLGGSCPLLAIPADLRA